MHNGIIKEKSPAEAWGLEKIALMSGGYVEAVSTADLSDPSPDSIILLFSGGNKGELNVSVYDLLDGTKDYYSIDEPDEVKDLFSTQPAWLLKYEGLIDTIVVDLLSKTEVGEMLTEKGIDNMVENCIMYEENDYEILVSLSNSDDPVSLGDSISHVAEAIMEVDVTDSIESD